MRSPRVSDPFGNENRKSVPRCWLCVPTFRPATSALPVPGPEGATPIGSSRNAASLGLYCPSHPRGWRGGRRRGEACRRSPPAPRPVRPSAPPRCRLLLLLLQQGASHADGDVAAGGRAALDARAARPGLGLAAAQWAEQQPQVEDDAGPARRHLHPEGGPAAVGEGRLQHGRLVAALGGRSQKTG